MESPVEHDAGRCLVVRMPLFLGPGRPTDIYLALFLSSPGKGFFLKKKNYLSFNVTTKFYVFIMNPLTILGKKYKIKITYSLIPQKQQQLTFSHLASDPRTLLCRVLHLRQFEIIRTIFGI